MNCFRKYFFLIILFVIGFGGYLYFSYQNLEKKTITVENFEVKKGDTISKVKNKLCKKDIINNCFLFNVYLYNHKYNNIKPGVYNFSGTNLKNFFKQLEKGPKIKYTKITILPGWTKFDIKNYLLNKTNKEITEKFGNLVNNKIFIDNLKNNYPILNKFGNINSLEGFLYPDTYFFKKSDLKSILFPELLIKTAIKNFSTKWESIKCNNNCNPYKLTNYEILILASIVEKEEKNIKNKALVADILTRRYKNNWFIGADWTLCYGLKVNSKDCKNYMFNKYLKDKKNIYNTRANLGLPPTPVGNPSISSIKAVLFPQKNNYWYYLHGKDGQIHFGKNASEHNVNKHRYLK